jgi:anti-sigma factor ChrR (cupin superfamily)
MLERGSGGEKARSTSLVRYDPGVGFPEHVHPGGEEILVLTGAFEDEHGAYPAGTYVRNPMDFRHQLRCPQGCTLFVKVKHFHPGDTERVVVETHSGHWQPGQVSGLEVMPLSDFRGEHTALVRWAPGTEFRSHRHWGGEEILVLAGTFSDEHGDYPAGTWLRNAHLSLHRPFSERGCTIFVKVGHL